MKKLLQIATVMLLFTSSLLAQFSLTVQVDMTGQTVSPNGVHVAGSFQNWNPAGTPMTNQGNGIWSASFTSVPAGMQEYKFINGNAWVDAENVPASCATFTNRFLNVTANTTAPVVCYGQCLSCTPPTYSLTLEVDMTGQTVSPNGVHVAGSFQGWTPNTTPLTNQGNGIWSVTIPSVTAGAYEYKFINGNTWTEAESVPGTCATFTNRTISIAANTTAPTVCFAQCAACPTQTYSVTLQVDMSTQTVSPNGVHVAGNFQGWSPNTTPLTNQGNGIWSVTVPNVAGNIEYKFLNGNAWGSDEGVPGACASGGNRSANITAATTIPTVCFGQCAACPTQTYSVTFQVDMSTQTVGANGVHVAGNFQSWNPSGTPLTNQGNGIWSVTVPNIAGNIEYKFVNGNAWGSDESVPGACASGGNRSANITATTTVPSVCFAQCGACPAQTYSVTLQVDMTGIAVSANGVYVAGSFQNWNPATTPLTNQGNGIWTVTVPFVTGAIEYKFVNGNAWGSDESVPAFCASTNGNRAADITVNTNVPTVCYASCGACANFLSAKIFLGSVDATGLMPSYLKTLSSFPTSDPYAAAPLNTAFVHVNSGPTATINPSVLTATGNNAIVDWVFLELQADAAGSGTQTLYSKSALLQADGDIVAEDCFSPVRFCLAVADDYYVKISHRNHLSFRTLNTVTIGVAPLTLNLTDNSVASYGPTTTHTATRRSMVSGDANYDGSVDSFDTIIWEVQNGLFDDYTLLGDYNLDGSVDAFDTILWETSNGLFYP